MRHNSASRFRWVLKVTVVILWLFAVVAAYFWAHKPFNAGILAGLGRTLSSVAVWCALMWLGSALGRRISGDLLDDEEPLTRLSLSAGIGLGLLSLLTLGLGLVGLLRSIVAWGLVLLLGIALWRDMRKSLADVRAVRLPEPEDRFQRWLAVYAAASLLLTFLMALAPAIGWDTLVYHLTGPRFFVEAGRIVHPIDLPYLGFPQLGEMQTTLGMLLVGDGVSTLFHFGYGLLALAITAALARRAFGSKVAWLAVALLLSVPTLLSLMTRAYVDATLLFYTTGALYTLFCWRDLRAQGDAVGGRGWLILMGLFCGFCGGVKYTAVFVPVALGLSMMWISRRDGLLPIAGRLALVAAVAIVAVLPGLLENWITTGSPVYPFVFTHGIYWDEWRGWWYDRPGTGLATTAPWRLLTAPLEATVLGTEGTVFYEATIGPLLLPSALLLVLVWRGLNREERAIVGHMLLFLGINYVLWLSGLARTAMLLRSRFLFLVFGAVAVLGGLALDRLRILRRPQLDVAWIARALMSITLALLLFSTLIKFLGANPLPVILGVESREEYLTRRLGLYSVVIEHLNRELPADAVVFFLWEPRSYHCEVECRPDAMLDHVLHATHLYGHDADAIAAAWRAAGVTHVLFHKAGLTYKLNVEKFDPITPADLRVLDDLRAHHSASAIEWGDAYVLYELVP